ncbi:MAG: hypothetical protein K2W96_26390 [Gemmataceae bacterium]|nr:hypothetical protein [Gemmataceae bacterium]
MSAKPYDDTFKELVEQDPAAWAAWATHAPAPGARVIDSDLSTVTGLADKVIRQPRTQGDLLIAIEAESSHAGHTPEDALLYSVLLRRRHGLPVKSVLLLLRPEANATAATGRLEWRDTPAPVPEGEEPPPPPPPYLGFDYDVVRLWQQPLAPLLAGSLALLPLAVLTNEAQPNIEAVGEQVGRRLVAETPEADRGKMVSALAQLMGLRYEFGLIERIVRRVATVEDNTWIRGWMERGERRGAVRTAREMLLRIGRQKLGEPQPAALASIEAMDDVGRLQDLTAQVLEVGTWADLLSAQPV